MALFSREDKTRVSARVSDEGHNLFDDFCQSSSFGLKVRVLLSCFSHNILPHPGTRICPLCDGDDVFGGDGLIKYPAAEEVYTSCRDVSGNKS